MWSAYHSIDNRGAVEDRDDAPDLHDIVPPSVDVSAVPFLTHSVENL